jgi:5-methylcytosine-specific restriction endonuclease McrA
MMAKAEKQAAKDANKLAVKLLKQKEKQSEPKPAINKISDKMKANPHKHKEVYWKYFGYDHGDFIPCEVCGNESQDIHHIDARGMGGDPKRTKDVIENLQALCRQCHEIMGDKKEYMAMLYQVHARKIRPTETI